MVESADTADSKSAVGDNVWVQVPLSAFILDTLLWVCLMFYTLKTHSNLADTLLTHLFLFSMLTNGYITLVKAHNTK